MGKVISAADGSPAWSPRSRRPVEARGRPGGHLDPHWWHDPRNAIAAVGAIRDALVAADPTRPPSGATPWLRTARCVRSTAGSPPASTPCHLPERKLVTDHDAFGYFAARYGITVVGAVIPSQTTAGRALGRGDGEADRPDPARARARRLPRELDQPKLAQTIARATGARSDYTLYGDTLGPKGSPGATYISMERANADAMVRGFTGGKRGCNG